MRIVDSFSNGLYPCTYPYEVGCTEITMDGTIFKKLWPHHTVGGQQKNTVEVFKALFML